MEQPADIGMMSYDAKHHDYSGQYVHLDQICTCHTEHPHLTKHQDLDKEADAIDHAVKQVLQDGYRTIDIMSENCTQVGCAKMGELIAERI